MMQNTIAFVVRQSRAGTALGGCLIQREIATQHAQNAPTWNRSDRKKRVEVDTNPGYNGPIKTGVKNAGPVETLCDR